VHSSYAATDTLSGLADPASGAYVFTMEGAGQSHTFTVTDLAGNSSSDSVSGVKIDKTAPSLSGSPDRSANAHGWYNADVTVSFAASDVLSGVFRSTGPTTLGEGANQSVVGHAEDLAGNTTNFTVSG